MRAFVSFRFHVWAFVLFSWVAATAHAETWQAGSASTVITPQEPIQMAGYGSRNRPADGKLTDLYAKALVLQDRFGRRAVLITADLVGIHRETSHRICQRLLQEYSFQREQIAINCSHTHTGPAVGMNLGPLHYLLADEQQQGRLDQYETDLIEQVVSLVGKAVDDLEPCTLLWGSGFCTFAVNRRNNPAKEVIARRAAGTLVGPYDHDVPVLVVRDGKKQLKTIVFGYACHATTLNLALWSGDYPGFAQQSIQRRYEGVHAMFWAGCGADQNPLPRRTIELATSYGERLASTVSEVVEGAMQPVVPHLETHFERVNLPLTELPTKDELVQFAESKQPYERTRAKYLLDRLGDGDQLPSSYPYPVASWRLGSNVRFVFLAGEVVIDYALRLKASATGTPEDRSEMIWVAGYSNDVMAYIPSRRVLAEGGYEGGGSNVYYGLPGLWSPEIENMIVGAVQRQWRSPRPGSTE